MSAEISANVSPVPEVEPTPYLQLKKQIRDRISSGDLARGEKIQSVRKLAAHEGVSPATVQRSIRELVQEGYLVSENRRGIFVADAEVKTEPASVGIIMSQSPENTMTSTMHGPLFQELQHRLIGKGAAVVAMQCVRPSPEGTVFVPRTTIAGRGLQAAVLVHVLDIAYIASLTQLNIPIIATDVDASDVGAHSVIFDNLGSSYALTRFLINRKHTRILFLGGMEKSTDTDDRFRYDMAVRERSEGFRLAMESNGLDSSLTAHTESSRVGIQYKEAMQRVLDSQVGITAVVTEAPESILDVLRDAGRDDIEVAGWSSMPADANRDEVLAGNFVAVAVCDFAELGRSAFETCAECMESPGGSVRRVLVSPHIFMQDR